MPESNLTKKAIALSAKELTKEKPYDKISISDIADRCGIKRQTFYYHFQDKYELLVWIYFNELFAPNMEDISLENWDEKLGAILTQMQEEKKFYINTIKHAEDYIIQYMLEVAEQTFEEAIDKLDEKSHLKNEERGIFARFFAYGICGIIVEWAKGGMIYPIMTDSSRSRADLGVQTVQKMIEFIRYSGFFYTYFRIRFDISG